MNNINRHNYETYFLLYTDNELSVAEKKAVDDFVQSNPDLKEELEMLQQSIVKPENIVFDKKGLLIREEIPYQVQENLLLHLDNELAATDADKMEGLIRGDIDINREWAILQQTKLSPDNAIVFNDKQSLFRKDSGRLVVFPWRRLAAAAVFIGFGVWGSLVFLNKETEVGGKDAAKNNNVIKDAVEQVTKQTVTVEPRPGEQKDIAVIEVITKNTTSKTGKHPAGQVTPRNLPIGDMQPIIVKKQDNDLPAPIFENVNINGSNKIITSIVTPEKTANIIDNPGNNDIGSKGDPANVYASTASFTDDMEESDNHILFLDEEKIKKTKLGGVFRKVKRVIERNVNSKPGSSNFKVANLEFAIQ